MGRRGRINGGLVSPSQKKVDGLYYSGAGTYIDRDLLGIPTEEPFARRKCGLASSRPDVGEILVYSFLLLLLGCPTF